MSGADTRLFAIGASHHTAPLAVRERFNLAPERLAECHAALRVVPSVTELLVLSTCNRLELYGAASAAGAEEGLAAGLAEFLRVDPVEFTAHRFVLRDREVVRHLLEVAAGTDSQIVGETEIFGQVKSAYARSSGLGTTGAILNRVFQKVFQAAKFIRTHTPIGEGPVSVATVAVDLAEKIFGDLRECRVLIVGTGEVGERTARALHSRGASGMTVLSRAAPRAQALAAAIGATPGTLERLPSDLPGHDIVIGSTTTVAPILSAAEVAGAMRRRDVRPLFFIDLGMPRNFPAGLDGVESVFSYDLDDLARIAEENIASRRASVERCRELARERADRIWEALQTRIQNLETAEARRDLERSRAAT